MSSLLYNLIVIAYIAFLLSLGIYFYFTSETTDLSDYMLGGRDIGRWPMAISDAVSVQTGFVLLAWVGTGYTTGFFGLWYGFGLAAIHLFIYRFIGPKFRKQSEKLDSQTIVDHLSRQSKGAKWSSRIQGIGVLTVGVFLTAYISAQIISVGELMDTTMGIDYNIGIVVGGVLVLVYVTLGGFDASIWTDVIQGIIAIIGIVLLPIVMIIEIGGLSAFVTEANDIDPTLISIYGGSEGVGFLLPVLVWFGFSMALIGQPHGLMRLQSIRSERLISSASIPAVSFMTISMIAPLFIGIAGRIIYPNIGNPETIALVALQDFLPVWLAGILAAGVLSIILSTTDSMMLVLSADFTRFYQNNMSTNVDERSLIRVGRAVIVTVAIFAIILAYIRPGTIFTVIVFAFVGLGVSLGVPLVSVLWWESTTSQGVFLAIVVGLFSTIANQIFFPDYFSLLAWPATIAAIIVGSKLSNQTRSIDTTTSSSND